MKDLSVPIGTIDSKADPDGLFRTLKYDLHEYDVTVIRSGYDFSKKTPGAAAGVDYLLDERGMLDTIKGTNANVHERLVNIGVIKADRDPDPKIRHKEATIQLARESSAEIENALRAGSKVVILRGAHDAMDLSSVLRVTDGKVGIVVLDTHTDINKPTTTHSGNPHGMWISILLGEGEGLDPIMDGTPKLDMKNIIYVGPSQLEDAERDRLIEKGIKVFTAQQLSKGMSEVYEAIDQLQQRVPIWLDVDEDGMKNAAATMPGGRVDTDDLIGIATQIGTNQRLQGMHQSLGVGISEFQAPSIDDDREMARAEDQAEVLKTVVHQALGAGYREDSTDTGVSKVAKTRRKPRSVARQIMQSTVTAAAFALTTSAAFFAGKNSATTSPPTSSDKAPTTLIRKADAYFLDQKCARVLDQFGRSAFLKLAADLREAVDSDDENRIQKALDGLVHVYDISLADALDGRTRHALAGMALGRFVEGFGYGKKTNLYYQMFRVREQEQRNNQV